MESIPVTVPALSQYILLTQQRTPISMHIQTQRTPYASAISATGNQAKKKTPYTLSGTRQGIMTLFELGNPYGATSVKR
jgi:hypothetical protein